MKTNLSSTVRLGILVLSGSLVFFAALYYIGKRQNLFGSTFHVSAHFHNVNGLMEGNNVRFAGIDVGTVKRIEIINDTAVNVEMVLEEQIRKYIKKTAIVSIGTDGLMGNKLVNINSLKSPAPSVEEGDVLQTLNPIETDEMLRTLNTTNTNIQLITQDLKNVSRKLSNNNSLWSLLMDTVIADNVKKAIVDIKLTGQNTALATGDLSAIMESIKAGKGSLGALITDTSLSKGLSQTIVKVNLVSDQAAILAGDLQGLSTKIKNGQGLLATLIMDTTVVHSLNESMGNIKTGTQGFSENMEALKHNFLFRGYYKRQARKNKN